MKIRLKKGLLGVPAGSVGQAQSFTVRHWIAGGEEISFTCTFDGRPGVFTLGANAIESVR